MNFYILESSALERFTEFVRLRGGDDIEDLNAALPSNVELISMGELSCYTESFMAMAGEHRAKWPKKTIEALDQISEGVAVWVPFVGADALRYAQGFARFTVTRKDVSNFLGEDNLESDLTNLNELRGKLADAIAKVSPSQIGLLRIEL